jgi:hypothetical protein
LIFVTDFYGTVLLLRCNLPGCQGSLITSSPETAKSLRDTPGKGFDIGLILVDNPAHVLEEKITKIFCENMKVLLFEDGKYKRLIFRNYNIGKNWRVFM